MRLAVPIVALALLAGCAPGGSPSSAVTALDATTHDPFFPIAAGSHHALGSDSPPITCNSCHGAADTFKQFDCLSCHQHANKAALDTSHGSLPGYVYASVNCLGCHTRGTAGQTPAGTVGNPAASAIVTAQMPAFSGTSIVSVAQQSETLPMPMLHTTSQVPAATLANCATCHAGVATGTYLPGLLHASLTAQPTSCAECHASSAPTGFVGPLAISPARTPPSPEMRHEAVAWANGAPTSTKVVQQDCSACHVAPSSAAAATWATGKTGATPLFHASLAGTEQAASCLDCHANSRPAGLVTSANVQFDHGTSAALGDCVSCHLTGSATQWTSWAGGKFHLAGSATPATCLPCHSSERPTTTVHPPSTWTNAGYASSPFDYVANHGAGLDCVACHAGPGAGAWGSTQNWATGSFSHGPSTLSGSSCAACHTTQRPGASDAAAIGFDHSVNGTGDCYGCHQATVVANRYLTATFPGGDWKGGADYPGSTLVNAPAPLGVVDASSFTLVRAGALITGTTLPATATIRNTMLHIAAAVPSALSAGPANAPDHSKCWHCHTNSGTVVNGVVQVTAYSNGQFHASLDGFQTAPGAAATPIAQPTSCRECHTQVPAGIVEKVVGGTGSELVAMDHGAVFAAPVNLGGGVVSGVAGMQCIACHATGGKWTDGAFHAALASAGATPADCTSCHYPLMADAANANVTATNGTDFKMSHASPPLTFQDCQTCHTGALANATGALAKTLWQGGAFHASLSAQPSTACLTCHAVSLPGTSKQSEVTYSLALGGTSSNGRQWMNHAAADATGRDCAVCHATDAKKSGSAWSLGTSFHGSVASVSKCQDCHGVQNPGGATPGTNNNLPATITNSSTVTSADSSTGVASQPDQISHADLNVSSRDCKVCHLQVGASVVPGVQGREWAQASFHKNLTSSLATNGTTARCSNCHLNVKPTAVFTSFDHSVAGAAPLQDCVSCHGWPGTGSAAAPNWLGAAGSPANITVGGFAIPGPPGPATQATSTLPHPSTAGTSCATCHTGGAGGKGAIGYDHNPKPASCNGCHEIGPSAGPTFVGTVWNGATSSASGAGDTRPFTLTALNVCSPTGAANLGYHFYSAGHSLGLANGAADGDCVLCHTVPAGNGQYNSATWASNWQWKHPGKNDNQRSIQPCAVCHVTANCGN